VRTVECGDVPQLAIAIGAEAMPRVWRYDDDVSRFAMTSTPPIM
jgi:hypothetical protein